MYKNFKKVEQKIDFPILEKVLLEKWKKNGIVDKYLQKNNKLKQKFRFIDGPITANNPMGVHHAWGRTLKDLWQRYFNMRGFAQRFQNGFDEQGLWVEVEVEKELSIKSKKDIENLVPGNVFESIAKFVNLCKERVTKYSSVQTQQSERLGYFMDWENSYHTSSDQNNYSIWHYLKKIDEKGWLYKGRDTVPWCPRCGTAISQHEILTEEYKELTHDSVYFKLPIIKHKNEFLLVWTTTPWTIPANAAVAVDPGMEYYGYDSGKEILWFLSTAFDRLKAKNILDSDKKNILKKKRGSELVGLEYEAPFDHLPEVKKILNQYKHRVIATDKLLLPISTDEGTGLVHIAPGCGTEDFSLGKKEKLPVISPIDESAVYKNGYGSFSKKEAKEVNEDIISELSKTNFLFKTEKYVHRYPTCWRCKTELVWRAVDEWYISMDKKDTQSGQTYRESMKRVIKDINWIPKWGYDRELDWLNNMHDWLISKKRYWGLALPIWECNKCGNFEVIGSCEELKEKAIAGWEKFEGNSPHRPWVDQVLIKCSKCGVDISRIQDVGSPWLDAGIVPFSTLKYFEDKKYWKDWFPADFITESFPGQFKNWFYSLIAMSTALENIAPFKTLLGYGQVRDEKGEEMHKSKGNSIEFNEAADKIGVDVMRWLYLRTKPEHNVNFGYHIADEIRRLFHLRLWNVYSFFVTYASINKWNPKKRIQPENVLDRWILSRMHGSIKNISESLSKFEPSDAASFAETFIVSDLSNWYVRRIRDRVAVYAPKKDKEDALFVLWSVLTTYSRVLAPMTPFITEEIYTNLTGDLSVHLTDWPDSEDNLIDSDLESQMQKAQEVIEIAHALRKENKIRVRQPLNLLTYKLSKKLDLEIETIIADEVNVKQVNFNSNQKESVKLDTKITPKLEVEGKARDLIRNIQEKRKEAGIAFNSLVTVYAPTWPQEFEELIKKETLATKISKSDRLEIKEN